MQPQKLQYCHAVSTGSTKKMLCIIYIYIKKEQTQKLYKIMHFLHIFKRVLGADSRRKKYDNTFSI